MVRKRPASKNWTLFLLRQRVKDDISKNGFGLGELQLPYEKTGHHDEDSNDYGVENDIGSIYETEPVDATVSFYI